ncbi:hypothetical protein CF319_g7533, partial [Tilletia indica]
QQRPHHRPHHRPQSSVLTEPETRQQQPAAHQSVFSLRGIGTLFACRVRTHSTSGYSPFTLVYGVDPRLPDDPGEGRTLNADVADVAARLPRLRSDREAARERSHTRALRNKSYHDERVLPHTLSVGSMVLVRNENPSKFEAKWFGPYRVTVLKTLGTYALENVNGAPLRALVHGNRLRVANVPGDRTWWNNPDHRANVQAVTGGAVQFPTAAITADVEAQIEAGYSVVPEMRGRPRRRGPSLSPGVDAPGPSADRRRSGTPEASGR